MRQHLIASKLTGHTGSTYSCTERVFEITGPGEFYKGVGYIVQNSDEQIKSFTMKAILALLIVLTSCGRQNENPEEEGYIFSIDDLKLQINKANKSYGDRFIKDDSVWYQLNYCKDACIMPGEQPSICGVKAIRDFYFQNGNNRDFKITIRETNVYGDSDLVVEEGTYSYPDGNGNSFDNGKFIALWKQEDGIWKLYREIWNSNVKSNDKK